MKKQWLRAAAVLSVLLILASGLSVSAARPRGFDEDGCMPLITEPGDSAQPLIYCRGNSDLPIGDVNWVDNGSGKAVQFNGVDEYFRIPYKSLQVSSFTLTAFAMMAGVLRSLPWRL